MSPVLLAVIASIFFGVGTALQKHGMASNFPEISLSDFIRRFGHVLKTLLANWIWLVGFLTMFSGTAAFAYALAAGDITVVQPIIGLTGVVAAFVGVVFLGERLQAREWFGVALTILGVVLVGLGGGEPSAVLPETGWVLLLVGLTAVATAGTFGLGKLGLSKEFTLSVAAGLCYGVANVAGKLLTQRAMLDTGGEFSLTGGATWIAVMLDYPIYVVIGANVFAALFFQTAFAHGRASVVSPVVTIISNLLPIIAALTLFGEHVGLLQGIGIGTVLLGTLVLALSSRAPNS